MVMAMSTSPSPWGQKLWDAPRCSLWVWRHTALHDDQIQEVEQLGLKDWPKFFMYAVLDKTVDELIPICEAYMERLAWLQSLSPRVLRDHLDEVARIKSEARDVYRTVRPLVGIIKV